MPKSSLGLDFGWIWKGLGKGPGRILELKIEVFFGFLSRHGDDDAVCRNSGSRHIAFFRDLAGLGPTWNVMDPHFGRLIEAELVLEGRCGQAKA